MQASFSSKGLLATDMWFESFRLCNHKTQQMPRIFKEISIFEAISAVLLVKLCQISALIAKGNIPQNVIGKGPTCMVNTFII